MTWVDRVLTWAGAGVPARSEPVRAPRGGRRAPVAFTIDLAADLRAAWLGEGSFAPRVSRQEALSVPAVKRVRDLICATLGTLELRELDPRRRVVENDLLDQPEPDVARSVTYTLTAEDMLFEEHAWWRITEFTPEGWPRKVRRLEARSVNVQRDGRVYVAPDGANQGMAWEWPKDSELIRFDSPWPGMLTHGARTIRDAMAVARAATRNVENPVPQGYFYPKSPEGVDVEDPPDVQEILDDWRDAVDQNSTPYLNGALGFQQVSFTPEQLQFKDTRDAVVLEVARLGNIDPEELGVSTTTRTYANAEQRRLDLLDFTIAPILVAMQDRLKMDDVTFPGNRVRFVADGFLKSDTLTRMQVYATGRQVGAYDDERIAEAEGLPVDRVRRAAAAGKPASAAPVGPAVPPEETVTSTLRAVPAVGFTAPTDEVRFSFDVPTDVAQFKADGAKRTVFGMVIPWNVRARSGGYVWEFAPGSLHWSADSRVKLDKDHGYGTEFGRGVDGTLRSGDLGLTGAFKVGRSAAGDEALNLAEDGVYDGLSAYVTFDGEGDGYEPHPDDPAVRRVYSATLRKVALTAMPAFDDARVQSVAANRENGDPMRCAQCGQDHAPALACPAPAPPPAAPPTGFNAQEFADALTAGMAPALASAVVEVIRALPSGSLVTPTRQVVPAGRVQSVREPLVYQMNGQGPSFVRDARRVQTGSDGDGEARARLRKFEAQTAELVELSMVDPSFAVTTGNASAVIPPGYRPDLYVSQLLKGRPLTSVISRGTISDATPFTVPRFVSATGATATHVEGVNPSEGSLAVEPVTITPGGISGLYKITREMADSANPAIDAIATQAMSESFSQQTEALVYAELNGTDGVGGTITTGFVPSGAQAVAVTEDISDATNGKVFLAGIRGAIGVYDFRRFAEIDFGVLSQEGVSTIASATDTTGRPLVPWVNSMNPAGTMVQRGYDVDGVILQKAWSMSGNAAGDSDVIMGNRNDVWCWESPVLSFRFEERSGPAFVELALFGYFAVQVLRPVGLSGIRLTVQA